MISFCTWVRDWPAIRQALPINLALTAGHDVEFVVVDCGSRDDTVGWLRKLEDPRVRVIQAELEPLHFAKAYNLSHRAATGDIIVCLDGDNVIGPRYVSRIMSIIAEDQRNLVHAWTGDWLDGTCGRLAMHRTLYELSGGYDESLAPVGFQDLDLRDRMQLLGARVVVVQDPDVVGLAIRSVDARKMQHIAGLYTEHNAKNHATSRQHIAERRLVANKE